MQFLKYAAAAGFLATQVLADGASIVAALNTIDAGTAKLNSSVVSWDGQLLSAIPILVNTNDLIKEINNGTSVAQASAELSTDDAVSVYFRVLSLASDVNITLTNIVAAKPKADKAFIGFVFYNSLKQAKNATDNLGAAIVAKVPASFQGIANSTVAQFDTYFNTAIAAYKSSVSL